nr:MULTISPECIES: ABC transporter substrate binding protein [unclassified Bradyrhizobium]
MREKGWIEGKNLLIEYRYARDRLPALAAGLIALTPDLLIASGPAAALALKSATVTIPVVFVAVFDPVGLGLVRSPPRTGPWRLEGCDPSQSGQPHAPLGISRGDTPHSAS